jgi:hypothetical protein
MKQDNIYNADAQLNSDTCWMNAKDNNNSQLNKYSMYYNDNSRVDKEHGTLPNVAYDHVNLNGRPGYGVSDDYLVDVYSSLRNNKEGMTRDRCPIQLTTRTFAGGPKLQGKSRDIDKELDFLSGSDSRTIHDKFLNVLDSDEDKEAKLNQNCNKLIMETTTNKFMPMLDCIKDIQDPNNIVPSWTRGGDDTRAYVNKVKFDKCYKNIL